MHRYRRSIPGLTQQPVGTWDWASRPRREHRGFRVDPAGDLSRGWANVPTLTAAPSFPGGHTARHNFNFTPLHWYQGNRYYRNGTWVLVHLNCRFVSHKLVCEQSILEYSANGEPQGGKTPFPSVPRLFSFLPEFLSLSHTPWRPKSHVHNKSLSDDNSYSQSSILCRQSVTSKKESVSG